MERLWSESPSFQAAWVAASRVVLDAGSKTLGGDQPAWASSGG